MDLTLFDRTELWIELPRQVDPDLAGDIEKLSVYVSPDLASLRVEAGLKRVAYRVRAAGDADSVRDKLERYLEAMVAKFRKIEADIHFQRVKPNAPPLATGVYDELRRRGWLFEHGQGQVSLAGPPLNLIRTLDVQLAALYQERFGAVARAYPAMIRADLLARCGYFEMHPNAVSFVTHLIEDFDDLERFRQANVGHMSLQAHDPAAFVPPHYCLNPAACFPCYEALEGMKLPNSGMALTWNGRVFRYESRNITGLDRLWEFSVRELVFVGSEDFVLDGCRRSADLVAELVEEWDLDCQIETATDPFFATVYAARTFFQKTLDVKREIRLAVEPGPDGRARKIAAGSINLHGPFFGARFDIQTPAGEAAISGCVGFGLERWVLAFFTQHGFEPSRWPDSLRSGVFG